MFRKFIEVEITDLDESTQEDLQDMIAEFVEGNFIVYDKTECEICGSFEKFVIVEPLSGRIRICKHCKKSYDKVQAKEDSYNKKEFPSVFNDMEKY